jgi:hypothetical protein
MDEHVLTRTDVDMPAGKTPAKSATVETVQVAAGASVGMIVVGGLRLALGEHLPWSPGEGDLAVGAVITFVWTWLSKFVRKAIENRKVGF